MTNPDNRNWPRSLPGIFLKAYKKSNVRTGVLQALPFWVASLITGMVAVLYTKLFEWSEKLGLSLFHAHTWLIFILTPFGFVSAWWIVKQVDSYAKGSGIPQVMAAIELANKKEDRLVDKLLNLRMLAVKVISSLL